MTASLSAPAAAESAPEAIDLNQFLALPETQPASEWINGKIIQKPIPQGEHSTLQADLVAAIYKQTWWQPLKPCLNSAKLPGLIRNCAAPLASGLLSRIYQFFNGIEFSEM
jgi:hypothetical protein